MKKTIITCFLAVLTLSLLAQKQNNPACPEPILNEQRKIMLIEFAEQFSQCPTQMEAVYYQFGYPTYLERPKIFKDKKIFQITPADGTKSNPFDSNQKYGDFVVIDDNKTAENIFSKYKEGDKLTIIGKTFTFTKWGTKYSVFFIAEKIINHSFETLNRD